MGREKCAQYWPNDRSARYQVCKKQSQVRRRGRYESNLTLLPLNFGMQYVSIFQCFVVDPLAEYNMPQYLLREFKVTDARDGQSRTVRQFQFMDWPEQVNERQIK